MHDKHARTIDYLRISLTDRCNLRCVYCMPEEGVPSLCRDQILRMEEFARAARVAAEMGVKHVRLTGGEPLVRKGTAQLAADIRQIPGIESVAITTNATLLAQQAQALKNAGIDRVNISLDTLDANQFRQITRRGNLEDALAGIEAAHRVGFDPIKINVVAVRRLKQDFAGFARLTMERPIHVRFIEYMPIGHSVEEGGCGWGPEDVIPTAELIESINQASLEAGLGSLVPAGDDRPDGWGPARYYKLEGAQGTIGFISSVSNHFCSRCNRMRLTADGRIRPCLFGDEEFDVREALRNGTDEDVRRVLEQALAHKPESHHHRIGTARMMNQVGG
ncbi:MAG: GTP 3',8-cyclase MoaA [Coriobacteriia bacterium]|nr:GTP 3',8-cyclase MoaA [Coriobacteriia bacterium]